MFSRSLPLLLLAASLLLPFAPLPAAAQEAKGIGVAPAGDVTATTATLAAPASPTTETAVSEPAAAPAGETPMEAMASTGETSATLDALVADTTATTESMPLDTIAPADAATSGTAAAAPEESEEAAAGLAIDYQAFWYSTDPLDESKVIREQVSSTEYERRKSSTLETKWTPLYTDLLNGSVAKAVELGFTPDKAALMIRMDPVTLQRIQESPSYRADVIKQMSEWSLFYDQLEMWSNYVEQSVLRESLADNEKSEYNPATVETELTTIYENLQNHAKLKAEKLYKLYSNPNAMRAADEGLVDRIDKDRRERQSYEDWVQDREKAMLSFADLWRRQYDGSEIWVNGTQYLVRNLRDVPEDSDDDAVRAVVPDNAVLLNVAKEKIVTPFDIITDDGNLKTVDKEK